MSKVIRVKNQTYQELASRAKWTDTMDEIISKLLQKENEARVV
jgi:hypothetical protein